MKPYGSNNRTLKTKNYLKAKWSRLLLANEQRSLNKKARQKGKKEIEFYLNENLIY